LNSSLDFLNWAKSSLNLGEFTRRIIVGNYLVYYDLLADAVHVLRVFQASRKIEELFP
jgi:plasmid stabilization system protein ParE